MAGAGDVNGDGYDDILIGALFNDEGGTHAGQSYLIFGNSSDSFSMDTALSNANASFIGEAEDDLSGCSVAGAGDVNGDGYDDILIGSTGNDEGANGAGQTYLIFGSPNYRFSMDTALSNANASFIGEAEDDLSGCSVAGAGDVNGDGYDDIIIGAKWGHGDMGQTYLFFGNSSDSFSMGTNVSNADASFIGEAGSDLSGCSVAGAGDVNGDGYDDILIGAIWSDEGGTEAGQTYLFFGNSSESFSMGTNVSNADASFIGESDGDDSGISVAGAGDVNGDEFDDILIGAYHNGEGGYYAGQTYLFFGDSSNKFSMDMNVSNADASFIGEEEKNVCGASVAGAGDVNGDGYDDILIGAVVKGKSGM